MAFLTSEFAFTGSLGGISAYKMRGTDKIVLRKKGGASREKIRTSPAFASTRRNNAEFGGRAAASKWIMHMLHRVKPLADYNIAGPLNAMLKPIQVLDQTSEHGKRNVRLSANPRILEGFSLNRKTSFNTMIRTPLTYKISKDRRSAEINIPQLIPGINFHAPQYPWFRIVAILGIVPDLIHTDFGYNPVATGYNTNMHHAVDTPWLAVMKGATATTLKLQVNETPPDTNFTIVLSVGIAFGTVVDTAEIRQVRYAGSAQVLAVK